MFALPVALSQKLMLSAELAAIQLKERLDSELPLWAHSALNSRKMKIYATIGIDENNELMGLKLSLSEPALSPENALHFSCTISTETFESVRSELSTQILENWVSAAVERRLKLGRELCEYSDDDLNEAIQSFGYFHFSRYDHVQIQTFFFVRLAQRELELREVDGSNHRRLDEYERARVLREQLNDEILRAQTWWDKLSSSERNSAVSFRLEDLPEKAQMVYAYRAYQTNRYGKLIDFNAWGEVSQPRKASANRRKKSAGDFVISV